MAKVEKISSNVTGHRIAEEASPGVLPATPVWVPDEPNEYGDYGADPTLTSRVPIEPSRQRKKGEVTDITTPAVISVDFTQENQQDIMQGFMFADMRRKNELVVTGADDAADEFDVIADALTAVVAVGGTGYAVDDLVDLVGGTSTSVARFRVTGEAAGVVTTVALEPKLGGAYSVVPTNPVATLAATGTGDDALTLTVSWNGGEQFVANDLIFVKNLTTNNGLFQCAGSGTPNTVPVSDDITVAEAGGAGTLSRVGFQFAAGDLDVLATPGVFPQLTTTVKDLTTLGLIPGELLWSGDDAAATQFVTAANNQRWRIRSVTTNAITLDKSDVAAVTEVTTTETIRVFFTRFVKNEANPSLQVKRTYQHERALGAPDDSAPTDQQHDYIPGSLPNQLVLNVGNSDKLTAEFSYVGQQPEFRTAAQGPKAGTRPAINAEKLLNISTDQKRAKIAFVSQTDSAPTPLVTFIEEYTLTVNNNAQENKATGTLGSCSNTAGTFEVDASATGYYSDIAVQSAVLDNDDVTFDFHFVKDNKGVSFDLPLIGLGDGRPTLELNQPIKVPLEQAAASGELVDPNLNHTLAVFFWDYLPDLADT